MPTYSYRCSCGHKFEVFQKMDDKPLEFCSQCDPEQKGKPTLIKVLQPSGIRTPGEGFERNGRV